MADRLDIPTDRKVRLPRINLESEGVGRGAEAIARFSGTPQFLVYLTIFVVLWVAWNTLAPTNLQFDRADLGFTALTLMLSMQASYSAPLILLAQNRQDDRDRVQAEQDRQEAGRNLADTEYLTREIAGLRMALQDVATRDFVRSELRDMLDDLREEIQVRPSEFLEDAGRDATPGDAVTPGDTVTSGEQVTPVDTEDTAGPAEPATPAAATPPTPSEPAEPAEPATPATSAGPDAPTHPGHAHDADPVPPSGPDAR